MLTSRTPVNKETNTTKKMASSAALPASTAKTAAKSSVKKPAVVASTLKPTARTKQTKVTTEVAAASKPRVQKKTSLKKIVAPEERYQMVAAAAYFLAERHGFSSGRALDDWVAAEKEINGKINS